MRLCLPAGTYTVTVLDGAGILASNQELTVPDSGDPKFRSQ